MSAEPLGTTSPAPRGADQLALSPHDEEAGSVVAMSAPHSPTSPTQQPSYAARLAALEGVRWKRLLNVQLPYQLNLRRLRPGRTLDVGCGIGRNLRSLPPGSIGVDHNADAVQRARQRGLEAYLAAEFRALPVQRRTGFETLLLAHVVEHMTEDEAVALVAEYLPCLAPDGKLIVITPQEKGYASDPTHVRHVDLSASARLVESLGLEVNSSASFPFPRAAGRIFTHNESVLVARTVTSTTVSNAPPA